MYGAGPRTVVPLGRFTYRFFGIIKLKIRNAFLNGCQFWTWAYLLLYVLRRANTQEKCAGISTLNSVTLNFKSGESFWHIWSRFNSCICDPLNCTYLRLYHVFLCPFFFFMKWPHVIQLGYFTLKKCWLISIPLPVHKIIFFKSDWIDS